MELTEEVKALLLNTAKELKGSARRMFMARTVQALFPGGQRLAERELGWNRGTIRKGMHEVKHGIACVDGFSLRGRKRSEDHLPTLLSDITTIVDGQSQADPQCRHHAFVYAADGDGSAPPIDRKVRLHRRGITHSRDDCDQAQHAGLLPEKSGQKSTPKKLPETDAIFAQVKQRNEEADVDKSVLRLSMVATATVKVGPFARGGKSRVPTKAADHDFEPAATVTPVGILLPASDELFLYGVTSKVTSDCLVDRLVDWWESVKERFSHITTLLINLDNGPESHSRRTQFMQRLVEFGQRYGITIRLAYYPPYHSKYNPIERCWGILEQHWNGALLDSVEAVIQYASTMTWKGKHPAVALVTATYQTGVKLTKQAMDALETQLQRLPHLDKWFVDIGYPSPTIRDS